LDRIILLQNILPRPMRFSPTHFCVIGDGRTVWGEGCVGRGVCVAAHGPSVNLHQVDAV